MFRYIDIVFFTFEFDWGEPPHDIILKDEKSLFQQLGLWISIVNMVEARFVQVMRSLSSKSNTPGAVNWESTT